MKKILDYFKGKSVKQRIAICVVLAAMLTLLVFMIKANFFDIPAEKSAEESAPQFHISIVDMLAFAGIIVAYIAHKIHEKRKQKRM